MNKIMMIFLGMVVCVGVAVGGLYFYTKNQVAEEAAIFLQDKLVAQMHAGEVKHIGVAISIFAPAFCEGFCERFLFDVEGSKGSIKLLADVNMSTSEFSRYLFCDAQGRPLDEEDGSLLLDDIRRCK